MSHATHYLQLPDMLERFADERGIIYERFSPYHMRLTYNPRVILDCWTTAKYWVKETNYLHNIIERQGETGWLPTRRKPLYKWLDDLFFAVEIREARDAAEQ